MSKIDTCRGLGKEVSYHHAVQRVRPPLRLRTVVGEAAVVAVATVAVAGIIALVHDLVITAGIYALVGFQVSPASVIGFLTILGYSLYDTVVVFDKVRENTQNLTATAKSTYSMLAVSRWTRRMTKSRVSFLRSWPNIRSD